MYIFIYIQLCIYVYIFVYIYMYTYIYILLLLCFYIASLWLRRFICIGRRREVFAPSSLCVWSQRPERSRQIILLHQGFLHVHLEFDG